MIDREYDDDSVMKDNIVQEKIARNFQGNKLERMPNG